MKTAFLILLAAACTALAAAPAGIAPGDLEITSDSFQFHGETNTAVWIGSVRVIDPPAKTNQPPTVMTCDQLTVLMPPAGGKIQSIIAENHGWLPSQVVLDQAGSRAFGDKAVFKAEENLIELTGNPAVLETEKGTLIGETVIYDREKRTLVARSKTGRVKFYVRQTALGTNDTSRDTLPLPAK